MTLKHFKITFNSNTSYIANLLLINNIIFLFCSLSLVWPTENWIPNCRKQKKANSVHFLVEEMALPSAKQNFAREMAPKDLDFPSLVERIHPREQLGFTWRQFIVMARQLRKEHSKRVNCLLTIYRICQLKFYTISRRWNSICEWKESPRTFPSGSHWCIQVHQDWRCCDAVGSAAAKTIPWKFSEDIKQLKSRFNPSKSHYIELIGYFFIFNRYINHNSLIFYLLRLSVIFLNLKFMYIAFFRKNSAFTCVTIPFFNSIQK